MAIQTPASNSNHSAPFIHHPASPNTHKTTLILLHGTSQTGPQLASTLLAFPIPVPTTEPQIRTQTLPTLLPTTKFVFPTGALKPTTVFNGRETHAWFDIHSFADRTIGEENQIPGLKESVRYLSGLVKEEIDEFEERGLRREEAGRRVMVLGFSAGCAVGVVAGLSEEFDGIGGFVGLSGWLPFRSQIQGAVGDREGEGGRREAVMSYLRGLLELGERSGEEEGQKFDERVETPVFLGHGEKDVKVKYQWGGEMRDVLKMVGMDVDFKSYRDLEHWINEDEMRDVVGFLKSQWAEFVS